ncbi:MAG TPA: hypothetical protein VHG10_02025 [Glycomyces sp.]|nr:hypothetical protein [Glycomyces sp.]
MRDVPDLGGKGRRTRRLIPDTPAVAVVTAAVTLVLAVILFLTALPGEERVLVYEGREVSPTQTCETVNADGETVMGACVELGEYVTRSTGWSVPSVVIAVVLAALAAVVLAGVPAQVKEARRQQAIAREFATDEDDRLGR